MKKLFKIIMLPTNKESNLTLGGSICKDKLGLVESDNRYPDSAYDCYVNNLEDGKSKYPQNKKWLNFQFLYIISDEKILKGDWCLHLVTKNVCQCDETGSFYGDWMKIIATTDTSIGNIYSNDEEAKKSSLYKLTNGCINILKIK